jgi:hypothetical protein
MQVILFSFGYKYGPPDADAVWDIRFLPNPYYVPALKDKTGLEPDVAAYVLRNATAENFFPFSSRSFFPFFKATRSREGKQSALPWDARAGSTGLSPLWSIVKELCLATPLSRRFFIGTWKESKPLLTTKKQGGKYAGIHKGHFLSGSRRRVCHQGKT